MLQRSLAAPQPPVPLPADVRLMNAVATAVFVLAALVLAAAAVAALARAPWFTIRGIQVEGDIARTGIATLRANALPRLAGNFFTVNLAEAREAFESVPWVRQAVVRRVFPDRLAVSLVEHRAVALWVGEDGNERLVDHLGDVFEANVGDVEDEGLPRFSGPEGRAAEMLSMLRRLQPVLAHLDLSIERLQLSGRGSWRAELDSGAEIELGRGTEDEVVARAERFSRTLTQVTGRIGQPLVSADLRHVDGYAVRLRGVTTGEVPPADKKDR